MFKKTYDQHIAIYENVISNDLCDQLVYWYKSIHEEHLTLSARHDSNLAMSWRTDSVVQIPSGVPSWCFPTDMTKSMWPGIEACQREYTNTYEVCPEYHALISDGWKIHSVLPKEGYHVWHQEYSPRNPYRVLAWMIVLQEPEEGGETEFLFQSKRIKPTKGNLLLWPGSFTHKHRGNCPLKGEKIYATGWFEINNSREDA